MSTNRTTMGYTFIEGLVTSGYTLQRECGAWVKEDCNGNLHSYVQDPDDNGDLTVWNYQEYACYDDGDTLVRDQRFTVSL